MSELSEKAELLPISVKPRGHVSLWTSSLLIFASLTAIWGTLHLYTRGLYTGLFGWKEASHIDALCPQTDRLTPVKHAELYEQLGCLIDTASYKLRAIDWLAGAVQIPTESHDQMGEIGEDPRWEAFAPFHTYLHGAFPLM